MESLKAVGDMNLMVAILKDNGKQDAITEAGFSYSRMAVVTRAIFVTVSLMGKVKRHVPPARFEKAIGRMENQWPYSERSEVQANRQL
jgi:hypothetical protein